MESEVWKQDCKTWTIVSKEPIASLYGLCKHWLGMLNTVTSDYVSK